MIRLLTGDCRSILPTLPAQSVHCCVTSPPYFGLRDYGTATWEGGDAECDHLEMPCGMSAKNTLGPNGFLPDTNAANVGRALQFRHKCQKCGATRIDSQIGLEPSPQAYVEQLVAVFREVRRVLRDDGTLWLNLGDSYAGGGNYRGISSESTLTEKQRSNRGATGVSQVLGARGKDTGLKDKDLIGIPWRVALALQADGWYLRQDIIWAKPNPMPESVTDRCTKAHEYIFLLSKNARYYYDADAIAEDATKPVGSNGNFGNKDSAARLVSNLTGNMKPGAQYLTKETRNKRSVWEIATQPYSEAHFATFPPALIEPCILAGCPKDGTVLDPFSGAGTTGLVADRLNRNALLIELNPQYSAMGQTRIHDDAPLFVQTSLNI